MSRSPASGTGPSSTLDAAAGRAAGRAAGQAMAGMPGATPGTANTVGAATSAATSATRGTAPGVAPEAVTGAAEGGTGGGYDAARALLGWRLARRAISLALADPDGLGGVALHGRHGPARDALLAELGRHGTVRRIPPDADDDALVGGLDTTATLARGTPVHRPGLLDDASGHVLLVGGAERLSNAVATRLCTWLDARDSDHAPLVALDESLDASGLVESALGERLALHVAVPDLALAQLRRVDEVADDGLDLPDDAPVGSASALSGDSGNGSGGADALEPQRTASSDRDRRVASPADVALADARLDGIVRLADRLGIVSLRAPALACRVARANAWLDGRDAVSDDDAALAVQLVLAARARKLPDAEPEPEPSDDPEDAPPEPADERDPETTDDLPDEASEPPCADADEPPPEPDAPEPPPETGPQDEAPDDEREPDDALDDRALPERLVEAVTAALPRNLLDELAAGRAARDASAGRDARASAAAERSGRPIGTRRPRRGARRRPNLLATLKAAIPHQRLRAIDAGERDTATGERPTLRVRRDDFRVTRYRRPTRTTTLFVVDASGSAAMHRLAEAKGAVESLLAECYVRRDRVALITFRGDDASLDLEPTRSLVRARRTLVGLPGGGGTPLAAGLDLAADQLERLIASGETPVAVIMTDGRANVSRDGTGGRPRARDDAEQAARRLARLGARLLFVDTGPRPRPEPQRLAALMRARYLALPQLDGALSSGSATGLGSRAGTGTATR